MVILVKPPWSNAISADDRSVIPDLGAYAAVDFEWIDRDGSVAVDAGESSRGQGQHEREVFHDGYVVRSMLCLSILDENTI